MKNSFEIERKYIIKKPFEKLLLEKAQRVIDITQTYIGLNESGFNCRIRKVIENGVEKYIFTEKKNINGIKRFENEFEISAEEYKSAYKNKLENSNSIIKTRYCISENDLIYEVDIFPFWKEIAVLEVELENENIIPPIPEYFDIIKEVTGYKELTNYALSRKIPDEKSLLGV